MKTSILILLILSASAMGCKIKSDIVPIDTVIGGLVLTDSGAPVDSFPVLVSFSNHGLLNRNNEFGDTTIYTKSDGSFIIRRQFKSNMSIYLDMDLENNNTDWYLRDKIYPRSNFYAGDNETSVVMTVIKKP